MSSTSGVASANENVQYDVVILGGGLAGLTLSLQLRQSRPNISILILEMRKNEASVAAHKVGESTVELGSHYLREVLNLQLCWLLQGLGQ